MSVPSASEGRPSGPGLTVMAARGNRPRRMHADTQSPTPTLMQRIRVPGGGAPAPRGGNQIYVINAHHLLATPRSTCLASWSR